MNYILRKLNCKALICVVLTVTLAVCCSVAAFGYTMRLCPNFLWDGQAVYVAEGASPRQASFTSANSVTLSYDSLADLVYYCNSQTLSTTLVYNEANDVYVGWVNSKALDAQVFGVTTMSGLLGNSAGKIYIAENTFGGDINAPTHWRTISSGSPTVCPFSYEALCQLVLDLNSVQQSACISTYYVSSLNCTYYVVCADKGDNSGKYYHSLSGKLYAVAADTADLSATIQVHCYQIKQKLTSLLNYFLNTFDAKLDTLLSVISNGKLLVDNSDVVSAIQSIPSFDDTDIITAIQSIPSFDDTDIITAIESIPTYDDTNLISAVTTISDQITEQFGQYDAPYAFPNLCHGTTTNKYISGVSPAAFTDIPDDSPVLYSTSNIVRSTGTTGRMFPQDLNTSWNSITWSVYPHYHSSYGFCYRLTAFGSMRSPYSSSGSSSLGVYRTVSIPVTFEISDLNGVRHSFSMSVAFKQYNGSSSISSYSDYYIYPKWNGSTGNWLGWYNGSRLLAADNSPSKRLLTSPPASGNYYIYGTSSDAVPVVYSSRFTGFLQSQADRVVNAIGAIPQPADYTTQLTTVVDMLDELLTKSNETVVNVINDATYVPEVLYLDADSDAVDTTKDGVSLFGDLVRWLWQNVFDGAFDAADVTKLDGLFSEPSVEPEEVA